ncbi:hypothetical protein C0Z17_07485 [Trinickia caryophylli]|nr:hypothetical protein C0Z17_07485 [Trinickia caryophylli]
MGCADAIPHRHRHAYWTVETSAAAARDAPVRPSRASPAPRRATALLRSPAPRNATATRRAATPSLRAIGNRSRALPRRRSPRGERDRPACRRPASA